MVQLKEMIEHIDFRKPVMKTRVNRSRSIGLECRGDGLSYLDHYPDVAMKFANETAPVEKLNLLRGFFFFIQHSCMEKAFRPWVTIDGADCSGECEELYASEPDCKMVHLLLSIDENEPMIVPLSECQDTKPGTIAGKRLDPTLLSLENPFLGKMKEENIEDNFSFL